MLLLDKFTYQLAISRLSAKHSNKQLGNVKATHKAVYGRSWGGGENVRVRYIHIISFTFNFKCTFLKKNSLYALYTDEKDLFDLKRLSTVSNY